MVHGKPMRCQASALETRDRDDLGVLSRTKLLNEGYQLGRMAELRKQSDS